MLRVCAVGLGLFAASAGGIRAEEPFHDLAFDKACEKAKAENKILMIDFYTTWCGPCKMLDRNTWPDAEVKKLLTEKTIALKVDAERNRELASKYRINSYPQIVFIRPDGTEIDRLVGYRDARTFLNDAAGPISGKDSLTAMREAVASNPNDILGRLRFADSLSQKGKPAEAMTEYLWCFDVGMKGNPEYLSTRSMLVVSKLAILGRAVPQALKALQERREAAAKLLTLPLEIKADDADQVKAAKFALREAAMALASIDRVTNATSATMSLYDELKSKGDGSAMASRALAEQLVDPLCNERRYSDIVTDGGEAVEFLADQSAQFESNKVKYNLNAQYQTAMKQQIIVRSGKYYEALLGVKNEAAAKAFGDRMLAFDGSASTYSTLITHSVRAGQADIARAWADAGLKAVPENQRLQIQRAIDAIPPAPVEAATPGTSEKKEG